MEAHRLFDRKHWWKWAVAGVVAVVVVATVVVMAAGDDGGRDPTTTTERSTTSSTTTSSTSTTSTTVAPATTASTTSPPSPTTAPTTTPPGPGSVAVVEARTGGGSGETEIGWNAVRHATGYRVLRSTVDGGPWDVLIEIDVTTGEVAGPQPTDTRLVTIWSSQHRYRPGTVDPLTAPDTSDRFQMVEVGGPGQRCYRVVAFNAAGDGPASTPACAVPPGG